MAFIISSLPQTCLTLVLVICGVNVTLAQILSSLDFKFREEQIQGSYIGNVGTASRLSATLTENEFSRLKFNLPDSKYFKIDDKTGILTSAAKIDREEVCDSQLVCKMTMEIVVYTSIGAGSYDILKVISIAVEVLDINDHAPEFPNGVVALTIPESNDLDQVLRTRSAVDKDTGENGVKQYRFQDFTDTFKLTVHRNPDGSSYLGLVLKERLDREVKDFYQVTVIAIDGGFPQRSVSVVINITVADINDNSPEFTHASYNETMQENMALKVPIMKVKAIDKDAGKNAEISYQFSSRVSNKIRQKFYIDEHTGEIFAQSNIDYEEDKLFQFIVEATDHGTPQQISRTNVNLHVIDTNDNSPQIVINLPPTGTEVSENEPAGKFIAHVSVIDLDSSDNGAVTCIMDDENFLLNKFSEYATNRYKVVLARSLDFEQSTYHRVSITCSDSGSPSLSNSTSFVVSVVDVNDNRPSFTESKYYVTVVENQDGDAEVLQVQAHDWDGGDFGRVLYFLEETYDSLFSIHQSTGTVKVLRALDREYRPRYDLYVTARDTGLDRLSSSALIVITVEDENDEPPCFLSPVYFLEVLENQPPGTMIGGVSAVDKDSPNNAKMAYSIPQQGRDYIHFSIDANSGTIRSKVTFDREAREQYRFLIRVEDPTKPSFSSLSNVTVRVMDVNDHAPVIHVSSEENATLFIQYSSPVGSVITNVFAHDEDEMLSQRLTFLIEKGDPDQLFDLDRSTGALTLARDITARDMRTYSLMVAVQDSGDPPRFDHKELSIKVNGTIPSVSEGGLSEHVIIAVVIVCVTVVLVLVIIATILLVRKFDRQRRRNRANQKLSEEKMYQINQQEINNRAPNHEVQFNNKPTKTGNKENKLSDPSTAMLNHDPVNPSVQGDKQLNVRRPPLDEECRLIEILKKNANEEDDDGLSDNSDDTDPSDSGRGGSEDETNQRGAGIGSDHPGNKHYPPNNQQRARTDNKINTKPYHQQKYLPSKTPPQMSMFSNKGKQLRLSESSMRSPQSSLSSSIDLDISGSRASQSRSDPDKFLTTTNQVNPHGNPHMPGRSSSDTVPCPHSQRLLDNAGSRLERHSEEIGSNLQSFSAQPNRRGNSSAPFVTHVDRPTHPNNSVKHYAPQTRAYKFTDRGYPLPGSLKAPPMVPEEEDRTTTSGSYTVDPEELKHELDALVLHDTVV